MENNEALGYSGTIAKASVKNKFFELVDGLTIANPEDYANIHGVGGSKHAPISGIKVAITDYSDSAAGKDNRAVYVSAHAPREIFGIMSDICLRNFGETPGLAQVGAMSVATRNSQIRQNSVLRGIYSMARYIMGVLLGKIGAEKDIEQLKKWFDGQKGVLDETLPKSSRPSPIPYMGTDWSYRQERVNVYSKTEDGFVRVSTLEISRKGLRDNGEASQMPWYVAISNFEARPKEHANGTTSYDGSSARKKSTAFLNISDREMYRCCYAVDHFVSVWEMANAVKLVRNGAAERKRRRIEAQENGQ